MQDCCENQMGEHMEVPHQARGGHAGMGLCVFIQDSFQSLLWAQAVRSLRPFCCRHLAPCSLSHWHPHQVPTASDWAQAFSRTELHSQVSSWEGVKIVIVQIFQAFSQFCDNLMKNFTLIKYSN